MASRIGLQTRLLIPAIIIVLFVAVVFNVFFWTSARSGAIEGAKANGINVIGQYKRLRGYYTKNVVSKVKATKALKINFDHDGRGDTIPLPATMIHDLGALSQQDEGGLRLNLYSKWPWPNRAGRTLDPFQNKALDAVEENSGEAYVAVEDMEGVPMVRVAQADKMTVEACVTCHNERAGTPKNDWNLGDVRGVLEVSTPIKAQLDAATNTAVTAVVGTFGLLVVIAILGMWYLRRAVYAPLDEVVQIIGNSSVQVASAASNVEEYSTSMAETSTETAANVQEASSSMEEMAAMTRQNSDHATTAYQSVEEARRTVENGALEVRNMAEAMGAISRSSQEIDSVLATMQSLSFQTNLLAVNAAIEAAGAGEAGQRFAMVADEVRNLSRRSQAAAKSTEELVRSTQEAIQRGIVSAQQLQKSFSMVERNSGKISSLVSEIRAASQEQARGIDEVNRTINQLDGVAQRNASSSEETASAAAELSAQAGHLNRAVQSLNEFMYGTGHSATFG